MSKRPERHEAYAGHEVLVAEFQQRGAVHAIGRRGETQEESGSEVREELAIGCRRGVVELVDDDVVEVVGRERAEVALPRQRSDGR